MDSSQTEEISSREFLYLIRNRFLTTLVLEFSHILLTNEPNSCQSSLLGSFVLRYLTKQLSDFPDKGSAVYNITSSKTLRQLLCFQHPYVVVFDSHLPDGHSGTAKKFIQWMKEVDRFTGGKFGRFKWIKYLDFQDFQKCFPSIIYGSLNFSLSANQQDDEDCVPLHKLSLVDPYSLPDDPPSDIIPDFLYLGGIQSTTMKYVDGLKMNYIISCGEDPLFLDCKECIIQDLRTEEQPATPQVITPNAKKIPIVIKKVTLPSKHTLFHIHYPIEDASHVPIHLLFPHIHKILSIAFEMKQKVLVHCYGGVSRSATLVIGFLMSGGRMTLAEAFCLVYLKRPWVKPNDGFWKRLQSWELEERVVKNLRRKISNGSYYKARPKVLLNSLSVISTEHKNSPLTPSNFQISPTLHFHPTLPLVATLSLPVSPIMVLPPNFNPNVKVPSLQSPLTIDQARKPHSPNQTRHQIASPVLSVQLNQQLSDNSELIRLLKEDAQMEGTLALRYMRNIRFDRVEMWWKLREIVDGGRLLFLNVDEEDVEI